MNAKVIVFSNFKGGAGKTSTGGLVGWELAKKVDCKINPNSVRINFTVYLLPSKWTVMNSWTIHFYFLSITDFSAAAYPRYCDHHQWYRKVLRKAAPDDPRRSLEHGLA